MLPSSPDAAIRILLIEDEAVLALDLSDLLQAEGYVVVGIASNGPQALALYQAHPVDLVLCDIRIQGPWDGIETVMRLGTGRAVPVIYLSAFSDPAMRERAVRTLPAAYLLKPVTLDSLRVAIELALYTASSRTATAGSTAAAGGVGGAGAEPVLRLGETIFIRHNYRFVRVPLADILLLQADNNHTLVVTETQKYALRLTLGHLLDRLVSSQLVRVHRSYAVNLGRVNSFTEQELTVTDQTVPISRHYREGFLRCFAAQ
jgi:two-component system, response regulator PdtaR